MKVGHNEPLAIKQRAAIFGLVIAGVPFGRACESVGTTTKTGRQYVPREYRKPPRRRWTPKNLAALRSAFLDLSQSPKVIAYDYGIAESWLWKLAHEEGWRRRSRWLHSEAPYSSAGTPGRA